MALAPSARAVDYTWQLGTSGDTNDVSNAANWSPAGGPPAGAAGTTQTDTIIFGSVGSATPTLGNVNFWPNQMTFTPDAQAYTFLATAGSSTYMAFDSIGAGLFDCIVNNSAQTQVITFTTSATTGVGKIGIEGFINTGSTFNANSKLVINAPISIADSSNSGTRYTALKGANDVYFNVSSSIIAQGNSNGGAWTNSNTTNMYSRARARFSMVNFSGRAYLGNIGTSYTGTFAVDSTVGGVLRLTNNNSLGAPGGTSGNGSFPAVVIYGGTTGNGTLELSNDITVTRRVWYLDGRSGAGNANTPHILNVSGNNTINVTTDWNTGVVVPITVTADNAGHYADAGNWNFQSNAGKLTIANGNVYNTENLAITVQLLGAGDGEFTSPWLTYQANPSFNVVKKGTGTWTYSNATISPPASSGLFAGTVDIQQGTSR